MEIKLIFTSHILGKEGIQTCTRHQFAGLLKILRRVISIFLVKLRVEIPHHVVERLRTIASFTTFEIEKQAEYCPFVVVRNLRIVRILILPVILDPAVKTRLLNCLNETTGEVLQSTEGPRIGREELVLSNQSSAAQCDVGIVIGNSLGHPKQLGVVFLGVIKWTKRIRTNSFHIPKVKKLMGHKREKASIVTFRALSRIWRA